MQLASEMTQQVKILGIKSYNQSLVSRTHIVKRENQLLQAAL